MKHFYYFALLCSSLLMAQPSVKGKITLQSPAHDRDFIVRHTKVVLLTKNTRDTVPVNENLEFEFAKPSSGTAFLYLSSPVLPSHTEYKFRVRKNKPTSVTLLYDRFQTAPAYRVKTPEEREDELVQGLLIARVAVDLLMFIHAVTR